VLKSFHLSTFFVEHMSGFEHAVEKVIGRGNRKTAMFKNRALGAIKQVRQAGPKFNTYL
jgi:hypothetical protein